MEERADEERPESVPELLELLELEQLDRNLYRGHNPRERSGRGFHLFGGQVAAQALRAASLTVPDGRRPHSMHGYFLRSGRSDIPTILHVDIDRDGRAISARRVAAVQDGEVIFTLSASFEQVHDGPELQPNASPDVPAPEDLHEPEAAGFGHQGMFDMRPISKFPVEGEWGLPDAFWARTRDPLPDDPLIHACVLTYLSDIGSGLSELIHASAHGGPSLDHCMWYHRHIRVDEWVRFTMTPQSASHGHGLYSGSLYSRDGVLGATIMQENLMRPRPPGFNDGPPWARAARRAAEPESEGSSGSPGFTAGTSPSQRRASLGGQGN
jgi:acyl-CoA thioesterase II